MPDDALDRQIAMVKSLSPEARARVADALRATIEGELAGRGGIAAAGFSRGVLFSKSSDLARVREVVLPAMSEMDDAKFEKFAQRLATLRQASGETGS